MNDEIEIEISDEKPSQEIYSGGKEISTESGSGTKKDGIFKRMKKRIFKKKN